MPPFDQPRSRRPTLLSRCSSAASAAETSYRLRYPRATQASRIIALDEQSSPVVCRLSTHDWTGDARFLSYEGLADGAGGHAGNGQGGDALLRTCEDAESLLSRELAEAELVVMVASMASSVEAASLIGELAAERGIMTTGLVLGEWKALDRTLSTMRPNAMVMVVSPDAEDLVGILDALRV